VPDVEEMHRKIGVSDSVFIKLRNSIVSGQWKPGDRIPSENALCEELGVSRVSVRAAIQRLASLGLVQSVQGKGTFVRNISGDQQINTIMPLMTLTNPGRIDVFEFRRIVEVESAGLAANRADAGLVRRMYDATELMEKATDSGEITEHDMEFHRLIAEATRNELIIKVYDVLYETYLALLRENVTLLGATGAEYHRKIASAIETRNSELAKAMMNEHINDTLFKTQ
jgi:GntR family transcriptional repressor for pyruvate dehydrogenase complex